MKPSREYFNEEHPFDATKDVSLLDALEQGLAIVAEADLGKLRWELSAYKQPNGEYQVAVTSPGDLGTFHAPTLREALRQCFNTE